MAVLPGGEESRAFLTAQGVETPPPDAMVSALAAVIDDAAAAWPELGSDRVGFAAFLGRRIPSDVDPIEALRGRAVGDLYLVHACLIGHPGALRRFDDAYLSGLAGLLARQGFARSLVEEIIQGLRLRLFTGERPALHAYSGVGPLKAWLRITALRQALRATRKERALDADKVTDALADATADPGLRYQRRLYQEEFRSAFGEAVASLSVRERNLLRQSVLYGATSDDLSSLYSVHRATAARWVALARQRLADGTRQRMLERLKIRPADYDSILNLIHSQLDVSIERVLGDS
jgi:RNA polymerase sigma-70 factor (ECF subfamily)